MLDGNKMDRLTKGLDTKSEKMRVLAKAGCQTADIARYLDVRYQFVRNVLLREKEKQTRANGHASSASPATESPNRTKLDAGGWVKIPERAIVKLGLKPGETLTVTVDDGEIRLMTIPVAVRKAQAIVRQFVPEGVSLVDELLEDRRREFERERHE
jgi:bifunctional DNA-binding transcriptional regulator/antitoxin component of YhaV-PrlF toxin-antitoxin module